MTTETELESLKVQATELGMEFGAMIGSETLRLRITEELEKRAKESSPDVPEKVTPAPETAFEMKRRCLALKRVRITCMNPNKKAWQGEFITVGNAVIGSVTHFVPFNLDWHIPQIILDTIKERNCQIFYPAKDGKGRKVATAKMIREFGVEDLTSLTSEELTELAQRQAMASGTI